MFAICFMALISCFTLFACGETPDEPETEQGSGEGQGGGSGEGSGSGQEGGSGTNSTVTEAMVSEKYNQIRTIFNSMTPNNGYTLKSVDGTDITNTPDWDSFERSKIEGLSTDAAFDTFKNSVNENLEKMGGGYEEAEILSYDATTKNGYKVSGSEDSNSHTYSISDSANNTLYNYSRYGSDYLSRLKYNIDENYYNQYYYEFYELMDEFASQILRETLEDEKNYLRDGFTELGLDLTNATFAFDYSEESGVTELVISLELNDTTIEALMLTETDIEMSIVLKADATMLKEANMVMSMSGTMLMPVGMDSENNPVNLSVAMTQDSNIKLLLSNTYDAEHAPSYTASEFVGTGSGNATENVLTKCILYIGGYEFDSHHNSRMGEKIDWSRVYYSGFYDDDHTTIGNITWYTDEACTQEFDGTMPSYTFKLYAKLSDASSVMRDDYVFAFDMSTEQYNEDIDYVALYEPWIEGVEKTGTVDSEDYVCYYIDGERYDAGDSYTLDGTKIHQIVKVEKPEDSVLG